MRTVKIKMRGADLPHEMAAMREWLDRNQYEAARFDCDQHEDEVVLSVNFRVDIEADAFERRFGSEDRLRGLPRFSKGR